MATAWITGTTKAIAAAVNQYMMLAGGAPSGPVRE